jgi:hypothetical protein
LQKINYQALVELYLTGEKVEGRQAQILTHWKSIAKLTERNDSYPYLIHGLYLYTIRNRPSQGDQYLKLYSQLFFETKKFMNKQIDAISEETLFLDDTAAVCVSGEYVKIQKEYMQEPTQFIDFLAKLRTNSVD